MMDVFVCAHAHEDIKDAIEQISTNPDSKKALIASFISVPLSTKYASAVLVSQNATESEAQLMRNYGCGGSSVKIFHAEKRRYVSNMARLFVLRDGKRNGNLWNL